MALPRYLQKKQPGSFYMKPESVYDDMDQQDWGIGVPSQTVPPPPSPFTNRTSLTEARALKVRKQKIYPSPQPLESPTKPKSREDPVLPKTKSYGSPLRYKVLAKKTIAPEKFSGGSRRRAQKKGRSRKARS